MCSTALEDTALLFDIVLLTVVVCMQHIHQQQHSHNRSQHSLTDEMQPRLAWSIDDLHRTRGTHCYTLQTFALPNRWS